MRFPLDCDNENKISKGPEPLRARACASPYPNLNHLEAPASITTMAHTFSLKKSSDPIKQWFTSVRRRLKPSSNKDMIMGEVLRRFNLITEEQLEIALNVQKDRLIRRGQAVRLGQIIVDLGFASEAAVVKAINEHYQLTVSSLSDNIKEMVGRMRGSFIERLPSPRVPIWMQLSITTTLVVLITTIALFILFHREKDRLYEQTVKIGQVSLRYFTDNARFPLLQDDILQLNALIKKTTESDELLYAVIVDNKNIIRAHTDQRMIGRTLRFPVAAEDIIKKGNFTYYNYMLPNGRHVLNLMHPVTFKDKHLGEGHVGVSVDFIERLIQKERSSVFFFALGIIALGLLTAAFLGFRLSRPISKLLQATEEISRGNYQYRVSLDRNDELGNLTKAFNRMGEELWKNSLVQKSFGKYVGTEVVEMITADPEKIWLRGHRNQATIFFADIRGFTHYSDTNDPEEVVEQLNEYFEITTNAIIQFGGYVDKFIGDAVLGVFGVPVYHQDHVERALRAALYLQHKLDSETSLNPLLGKIGVGIDTGLIVSGNIGSQVKMEYTVIGDCVNVASRLNGLAHAGEIIISNTVRERISGLFLLEELPPQSIKGKTGPMKVFRVLGGRK